MRTTLLLALALCGSIAAQASYLPLMDNIRSAIVNRQVAISNAPPIDGAGKKELNTLKVALKTVDKPSTTLKSDLTALAKVVAGINKGASNETFSFEFASSISNYVQVLALTNDTLQAELANATNNLALKQKAQEALDDAGAALAAIQPQTDLNGAAKALGAVLKQYGAAAKAVATALKAKPTPVPAPKSGTLVAQIAGQLFTVQCFTPSTITANRFIGTNDTGATIQILFTSGAPSGAGTYPISFSLIQSSGGQNTFYTFQGDAHVTAASSSGVAGNFSGTGSSVVPGSPGVDVGFDVRFSGKILFRLP